MCPKSFPILSWDLIGSRLADRYWQLHPCLIHIQTCFVRFTRFIDTISPRRCKRWNESVAGRLRLCVSGTTPKVIGIVFLRHDLTKQQRISVVSFTHGVSGSSRITRVAPLPGCGLFPMLPIINNSTASCQKIGWTGMVDHVLRKKVCVGCVASPFHVQTHSCCFKLNLWALKANHFCTWRKLILAAAVIGTVIHPRVVNLKEPRHAQQRQGLAIADWIVCH